MSNSVAGAITFQTTNTERMRIDSSGNVSIGGFTANAWSSGYKALQFSDATGAFVGGSTYGLQLGSNAYINSSSVWVYGGGSYGAARYEQFNGGHNWYRSTSTPVAGNNVVWNQAMTLDNAGNLLVGTTNNVFGSRLCVQGTAGSSTPDVLIGIPLNASGNTQLQIYRSAATSGYVGFETINAGVSGCNFVINALNAGNVLVGTASALSQVARATVVGSGNAFVAQCGNGTTALQTTNTSGTSLYYAAIFGNDGNSFTTCGYISVSGTTTIYAVTSDYRLKKDVQPMTGALAKVAQLKPVTYKWKADGSDGQGFIAHELAEVMPDCVSGQKDAVKADGSIMPQGVDTSFLVATLTKAIQEQQALIESLTTRLTALENK
jgi:hypothetical protein